MAEENSGTFSSFWQRSVDKISPRKVKFMPNVTQPAPGKNEDEKASSALTAKQHRRAQVRKAQIEHRQRKQNYVKHLEEDVIRLRDMIAAVETEASAFKKENAAIKTTLNKSNLQPKLAPSTQTQSPQNPSPQDAFASLHTSQYQDIPSSLSDFQSSPQDISWPSNESPSTTVSICFDDLINTNCLQISPRGSFSQGTDFSTSPNDAFSIPIDSLAISSSDSAPNIPAASSTLSKPLPRLPDQAPSPPAVSQPRPDLSTIAINFILALEHPCRTHFHASSPASSFDPRGDASGHELMCSTLLYSSAPAPVFSNFNNPSASPKWTAPSLELTQLYAMSQSLQKGDWEITPVQAWFMLVERYDISAVIGQGGGRLEKLKKGLGKLVGCFAFGAVMEEGRFWEVVSAVMGS